MNIKLKLSKGAIAPFKASVEAACFDVHAYLNEGEPITIYNKYNNKLTLKIEVNEDNIPFITIESGDIVLIPTGLSMEIPNGYYVSIRPRSSSIKEHRILANSPSTIDSDYRGMIFVPILNASDKPIHILTDERIAQIELRKTIETNFIIVDELNDTIRGDGGFGSTGK